jgi:membrane-associated phospholipid phosphatase
MSSKAKGKRRELNELEKVDVSVAKRLEPVRKSTAVRLIGPVAELGDQPPLYAMTGGVIAAGLAERDWSMVRTGARMMAAHAAATTLKSLLKFSIDRTRPPAAANGHYELREGKRFEPAFNSFPSGHTASSVAVARALGRDHPELHEAALAAASTVATLQVVRGKHFVSDIAAGAALGLLAEKAVDLIFRRFPARPA